MAGHVTWSLVAVLVYMGTECTSKMLTVRSMVIQSHIRYRFATTTVTSTVVNDDVRGSHEALFEVNLPEEAFISNFSMTVDGEVYAGRVEEKQKAADAYHEAKASGQSAGYIKTTARHSNKFDVSVNLKPASVVTFNLTYQQVLVRCHGKYEHKMHLNPGRVLPQLQVEVFIEEARNILELDISLKEDLNDIPRGKNDIIVKDLNPKSRYIMYRPSQQQQRQTSDNGINGEFIVKYDVERTSPTGEVLIVDGYFLHFFAPENTGDTPPVPKDIVFVLDVSGSMTGIKIRQLKDAMVTILRELSAKDTFNIVTFNDELHWWKDTLVPVNSDMLRHALHYVNSVVADDSTDINLALTKGVEFLLNHRSREHTSIVFFLTDGEPTVGVKDPASIANNVVRNNEHVASVFGLAFGEGADYNLIKVVSAQNNGFARRIYEAADASEQVKGFYDEISSTMMLNLSISYINSTVQQHSLTPTFFRNVFKGNDVIVAGKVNPSVLLSNTITGVITAETTEGTVNIVLDNDTTDVFLTPDPQPNPYFKMPVDFAAVTEKSWAYLTIKSLLKKKKKASYKKSEVSELDNRILKLSLKYNFVTPLTSMVATKPDSKSSKASIQGDEYEQSVGNKDMKQSYIYPQGMSASSRYHQGSTSLMSPVQRRLTSRYNGYYSRAMGVVHTAGSVPSFLYPKDSHQKRKMGKSRSKTKKMKRKTCRIVKTNLEGFGTELNDLTTCTKVKQLQSGSYILSTTALLSADFRISAKFTGRPKASLQLISVITPSGTRYSVGINSHNVTSGVWNSSDDLITVYKHVTCRRRRGTAKIFLIIHLAETQGERYKRDYLVRRYKAKTNKRARRKNSMFRICTGRPAKQTLTSHSASYLSTPIPDPGIADFYYKI